MILVDSGVWLGWFLPKDKWHRQSKKIIERLINELSDIGVCDHVIDEIYNFLLRRLGWIQAQTPINTILGIEGLRVYYTDELTFKEALILARENKDFSLTDAIQIIHAKDEGIKQIASFDKAFDTVKGIKRVTD